MAEMLFGISQDHLYIENKQPQSISQFHNPYFLAFGQSNINIDSLRNNLIQRWEDNKLDHPQLSKIKDIGEIETYQSFSDFNKKRKIFKIYTTESYVVPDISSYLFFNHNLLTAEHDIPYKQRALTDLSAENKFWPFDTSGGKKTIKTLIYDIETIQFAEGKKDIPIDIIGYSGFDITFESEKDIDSEQFSFEILDIPSHWNDIEIKQMVSRNPNEEIDNLITFCKEIRDYDVVSGHNIAGFDNYQIYQRVTGILNRNRGQLSENEKTIFNDFITIYARPDKSFHFGMSSEVVQLYPCSFDTYIAARKFYSFLNEFSLKALAPFLGILIKDRIILPPSQIKLDDRTLQYNKHDMQEQIGVTLHLIQQALPLAFTTCMPFDMLLPAGAVNMWDHMALIRGARHKKIMPPICRVKSISQILLKDFKECSTKADIVSSAKKKSEHLPKDFVRVVKYGDEMPEWVEYPYVIYNEHAQDADESLNYHMPGGMTIKPDSEAHSHFIPWYHVVVADVGAMYPTILKAMNVGADTVKLAHKNEIPDEWIWLKKLPLDFLNKKDIHCREVSESDSFADKGYMLGIKIDPNQGVVNGAMTGIMSLIGKIKKELKTAKEKGDKQNLEQLKMMYQSMKGARNAGTHGILSAPGVTGRQFNLWGGAAITTKGQHILADTLNDLEKKSIRVVYGDTDGIYLGCARSAAYNSKFLQALNVEIKENEDTFITKPEVALSAIQESNLKWQKQLNYPDFELEPEEHDAMIFVKHKNYLIFDCKNGKIVMNTKGNNFKGSDKANIARKVLDEIMMLVLKENIVWNDEEQARQNVKESIQNITKMVISKLDLSKVDIDDLTLIQSVQPAGRYKKNQDGSISTFGKRSMALEKILGRPIKTRMKHRFVVTKKPLPGITNPSKSGVKPIDYMYPVEYVKNKNEIDLEWYKKMVENYIQGAFGLSAVQQTEQLGLDAWM
ncbi:MAG: DNA polymerase domain-containing protein [Thermoplasmatota archaeon]